MAGILVHAIIGLLLAYLFIRIFNIKEKIPVILVAVWFSTIPDTFCILYYLFGIPIEMYGNSMWYFISHPLFFVLSFVGLVLLRFKIDLPHEKLYVIAFLAVVIHFIMDLTIQEIGILF